MDGSHECTEAAKEVSIGRKIHGVMTTSEMEKERVLLRIVEAIEDTNRCKTASHKARKTMFFARQCVGSSRASEPSTI